MISVIVPVFNVEQYIDKCIDSILMQTYTNFEMILVDDGSTDSSGSRCDEYMLKDDRIKSFHKVNGGLSDARNFGIKKAKGEYVCFVDSDDYIHPKMLEILLECINKYDAEIASCQYEKVLENTKSEILCQTTKNIRVYSKTEAMNHISEIGIVAWNKIYKREIFNEVEFPIGKVHEDEFIFHKVIYLCNKIVVCDEILYYYVQREYSIMNSFSTRNLQDAMEAFEQRISFINDKKWGNVKDTSLKYILYYLMKKYVYLMNNPFEEKRKWKRKIIEQSRFLIKQFDNTENRKDFILFCKMPLLFYIKNNMRQKLKK